MQRRRRITPKDDARFYIDTGGDKAGLDVQYINAIKDISPGEEITYNYGDSDWPWRCKGEVMPLETCATQATSPNENIEEMVKNSDCTESYMKMTGPVLSPLSRAEKMVKNSDCTESYMKMTGPVLSPLSRAEKFVFLTASALPPAVPPDIQKISQFSQKQLFTVSSPACSASFPDPGVQGCLHGCVL
ncbi:hypothetical protein JOQ06_016562 [Pogonophryne albipinna]|uniref:SET domain-containing protein n=1 Tax=Pogonophryne albipinna TaxID=1090488 RepID=A0AAD6F6M5_9TELE|nr:hypothetical protein JOQ06_016562 [Pogonophryne albipinna]